MNTKITPEEEFNKLPVTPFLPTIISDLKRSPSHFLVLTAETAAGKSTAVPIALYRNFPGKIIMIEPRRLAVVAIANRISQLLGEIPGKTVGYRLHLESIISPDSRIEIMTEAILIKQLQNDSALTGISVIIIDEFHERSVYTDLVLAFLKETMILRDDLYVIVMSATIDTERTATYLGIPDKSQEKIIPAPVISIPGRRFPVSTMYYPTVSPASAIIHEIENRKKEQSDTDKGAVLVFLPGIAEIRSTQKELLNFAHENISIHILHSSIPFSEQKAILTEPSEDSDIRIILSSAVAETSLTVPGVTTVIDCGLSRINRMDVSSGMEKLVTEPESIFSAEQRRGRAGRTAAGKCIRLWAENDPRVTRTPPEILRTDLVPLVLECAKWGITTPEQLSWLDPPPEGSWTAATLLLKKLNCIDAHNHCTKKGSFALTLGLHPRLACVAINGYMNRQERKAVDILIQYTEYADAPVSRQNQFRQDLLNRLYRCNEPPKNNFQEQTVPLLLLEGYPDRIARNIENTRDYQFPSGRIASLKKEISTFPKWIVAPVVNAGERSGKIYSYEPMEENQALQWLMPKTTVYEEINIINPAFFNTADKNSIKIKKTEFTAYGKILLKEKKLDPSFQDLTKAICSAVEKEGLSFLPLNSNAKNLLIRTEFLTQHTSGHEDLKLKLSELSTAVSQWLLPFLSEKKNISEQLIYDALYWYLDGYIVDQKVPQKITLQNGKTRQITYEKRATDNSIIPVMEIIIQQIFGCFETPKILGIPVLLKLLSPASRPLQITNDLNGFWINTWPEICKEMKGRYPKHNWDYKHNIN